MNISYNSYLYIPISLMGKVLHNLYEFRDSFAIEGIVYGIRLGSTFIVQN